MKKILITIVIFMMLTNIASAFTIKLTNTVDKMVMVRVIWLACDWEGFPARTTMLYGELQPGETTTMSGDYRPGPWSIEWSNYDFGIAYEFIVPSTKGTLI